ncbi:MAG: hypothetical protein OEW72_04340 [Gammaproteobacteria bacterium]|nr:hypothetical protein [Gammaproteobacteria bacterium]
MSDSGDHRLTRRDVLLTMARAGVASAVPVVLTACDGGTGALEARRRIAAEGDPQGGLLLIDPAGNTLLVTDGVELAWRT